MAGGKPIRIAILADARKAIAETDKMRSALGNLAEASGASKLKNGLKNVAKGVAVGVGAAIVAVGALAVQTGKDLARVERLGAQTEAVIKATGGAAGRSKAQVDRMAQSLERVTGVEAETVTEGQNMLLTFKNIKGNQFDQATKAALDMGVAMNKGSLQGLDLSKTSIQLGKALNDPVKGISALSKVGVSFNEQQKEQIKNMVAAGDVAGAQGVILKELQGEFGGAAKAAGQTTEGMIAKVQNSFGNIAEEVFSFILPLVQRLADFIQTKVLPAIQRFGDWMKTDGIVYVKQFGDGFKTNVLPGLKAFGDFIMGTVLPAIISMGQWIVKNRDWLSAIAVTILTAVAGFKAFVLVMATVRAAIALAAAVQAVWNVAMAANPIGIIILAVAALVAGLVWFFTKTKTGQAIVKAAWAGIQAAIQAVTNWWQNTALPIITAVWTSIVEAFKTGKQKVGAFLTGVLNVIKTVWKFTPLGLIVSNWTKIINFFKAIPGKVKSFFSSAIEWLKNAGKNVLQGLRFGLVISWLLAVAWLRERKSAILGFFSNSISWLRSAGSNIISSLKNGLTGGWSAVSGWLGGVGGRILNAIGGLGSLLYGQGKAIIDSFLNGLQASWGAVTNFVSGIAGWIADHKGPISLDRRLLIPAGKAIMNSLKKGLEGEIPGLKKTLQAVTDTITKNDMGNLNVGISAAGSRLGAALKVESEGYSARSTAPVIEVKFESTGDPILDAVLNGLRKTVRVNGGNVQAVLGPA